MAYVRLVASAVEPAEVELLDEAFRRNLKPGLAEQPGCLGVELLVGPEPNAGGLVDVCFLTRWESLDEMSVAVECVQDEGDVDRVRSLLRQEPVVRVFRVLD